VKIKVYSTKQCIWCSRLKNFLKEHNIHFEELDIGKDKEAARKLVETTKEMGVPQTEIIDDKGKSQFIIGFNEAKFREVLHIKE